MRTPAIVISCFIFASCSKSTNTSGTKTDTTGTTRGITTDTTIYIAGNNGTNPVLWKKGIPDTLSPTTGSASQVTVSGSDVYVAGVFQENQLTGQYGYWKNGIQNNIDGIENIGPADPSISIAGNNVYYSNGSAWENGTIITLPGEDSGYVVSTFAIGTDVYFAGADSAEDAVYWKNGILNVVAPYRGRGSTVPHVSCIYVSGSDIYVGGMYNQAVYWENGIANFLQHRTTDSSFVSSIASIFVSGNDVYTTGYLIPLFVPPGVNIGPAYWKNGVENDLSVNGAGNGNTTYTTTSIFLNGSDVYVAGYTSTFVSSSSPYLDSAVYWKNGVEINLNSSGRANSIFVRETTH